MSDSDSDDERGGDESDEDNNAEEEEDELTEEKRLDLVIEQYIADYPLVEFEGERYDRRTVSKIDVNRRILP